VIAHRIFAAALCLSALATFQYVDPQTAAAADINKAAKCTAIMPPFGGSGRDYKPPTGTIDMGNDGGWCWLLITRRFNGQPVQASGSVARPPSHGTIQIEPVNLQLRVAYRPSPGFAGTDTFEFIFSGTGQERTVPVQVTVSQ
jgi:hypothetical protein